MLEDIIKNSNKDLEGIFTKIDEIEEYNSSKVLDAFIRNSISESDFNSTTGYGYNDIGRDKIERVFADIFKAEAALVRCQFISGTHALTTCFFGLLRPGDTLLSISGKPYDTLDSVIGFNDNPSSLKAFNVKYEQIDLIDNDFDYVKIEDFLKNNKVKVIEIQRSKGLKKVLITKNGKTTTYTSKKKNLDGIAGGLGVFTFGDCQNYYASQSDLKKYGLDSDSRITVDITYKDTDTKKTKNIVLYIGKKDSDEKNYYVQLKGSHMVYLSDKDVVKNILN